MKPDIFFNFMEDRFLFSGCLCKILQNFLFMVDFFADLWGEG